MKPLFVSCPKNSEHILEKELSAIINNKIKVSTGGVFVLHPNEETIYRIVLQSATAIRVLLPILEFDFTNEKDIYNHLYDFTWDKFFKLNDTFLIQTNFRSTTLSNSNYISQLGKDAICDFFRKRFDKRPSVDKKNPRITINIYIYQNHCQVGLDCAGRSLNKRGYRKQSVDATLKETLAASMILLSRWDFQSPFYDLMCGSGTLPIEAALQASKTAPGSINPRFSFQNWISYQKNTFTNIYNRVQNKTKDSPPIFAGDIDPNAVLSAKINAHSANMDQLIRFSNDDFFSFIPKTKGLLLLNPPYGVRLGSEEESALLFKEIGVKLKNDFKGFEIGIISPSLENLRKIGMSPKRKYKLYNGNILCYFQLYKVF